MIKTSKMTKRALFKNGDCNIIQSNIPKKRVRFLQDIFTTLVDSRWRWTLAVFSLGFFGSWLLFAIGWWLIALVHGDLQENHLPINQAESNWIPCVSNIVDFTSCFLFSVETQHTTGYGWKTITDECPEAIFLLCLQNLVGLIIEAFMVGIFFTKMTRPKLRTLTLKFSQNAVICERDGSLCFMFRVGDMRKSHIIGAKIRAQIIHTKKLKEGDVLKPFLTELPIHTDGCDENLFFIWPMTMIHKIDENSPFYQLSAEDMIKENFEILVVLEGTIESTDMKTQARSSYLASEILWGHRFESVVDYDKEKQGYKVDYAKFDSTIPVNSSLRSTYLMEVKSM